MANHPTGLGKERIRQEMGEAHATSVELAVGGGAVEADAEDAVGQTTALTRTQASSLLWLLDTDLEENRDGNDMREHHRPCVQSRCAQVCALAALRGDQPDRRIRAIGLEHKIGESPILWCAYRWAH